MIANHPDSFRACLGKRAIGYFVYKGDSLLVFEDGSAFVLHHENGSYWVADAQRVREDLDDSDHVSHIKPRDALALQQLLNSPIPASLPEP